MRTKPIRAACLGTAICWLLSVAAAAESPKRDTRSGYSIFRETLVDLTWPEVKKAAEANAIVLLPVGVIEEHGPHMGLGTDTYIAYSMCLMVKRKLEARQIPAVIAPPIYWGIMDPKYHGSFAVRPSTMKALLMDVFADLKTWGFRKVYAINRHGDRTHRQIFNEAMTEARESLGLEFYNHRERKDWEQADKSRLPEAKMYRTEKPFQPDYHAGAFETAVMLAYYPEEVDVETAASLKPQSTFDPLGYVGDPANYGNANGRVFELAELDFLADLLARWARLPARE